MRKFSWIVSLLLYSPFIIASNFNVPAGFEYLMEHGIEIDVLLNTDKEDSDTLRTARMRYIGDAYQLSHLSQDFMSGVQTDFHDKIIGLFNTGLPENGVYCNDAEKFGFSLKCSDEELLLKMSYDSKKLLATLYIAPQFLDVNTEEGKIDPFYLPPSSTSDKLTSIANYELYSSKNNTGTLNNLSLNSITSKGDKSLNLGGNVVSDTKSGKNTTSNATSKVLLTQASLMENSHGYAKTAGLIKGHSLSTSVFSSSKDVFGFAYGTSEATKLKVSRPSDIDVVVLVPSNGRIESYRDGILINTQFLSQGVQTLDTKSFPEGIYEVELKIYQDEQLFSTQKSYIYKSAVLQDRQFKLWGGSIFEKNKISNDWIIGGSYSDHLSPSAQYTIKNEFRHSLYYSELNVAQDLGFGSARAGIAIDTNGNNAVNVSLGLRHGSLSTSHLISWSDKGQDSYLTSQNAYWQYSTQTNFSLSLAKTWYEENNYSVSFGINHKLQSAFMKNWHLQSNISHTNQENYFDLNLQIPLTNSARAYVRYIDDDINTLGISYNYSDRNGFIRSANLSLDQTNGVDNYTGARGVTYFEGKYSDGSVGGNWNSRNNSSMFANVTGSLYLPGGPAAGREQSAIMINVDPDDVGRLKALTPEGEVILNKESTLIPLSAYSKHKVTVDVADDSAQLYQIENRQHTIVTYPGNVKELSIKAKPIFTVIGRLLNKQGDPLPQQNVMNHLGASFTSEDGIFSLEVSTENPSLTWMSCEYDLSDKLVKGQSYIFLGDITACDSSLDKNNIRLTEHSKGINHSDNCQQINHCSGKQNNLSNKGFLIVENNKKMQISLAKNPPVKFKREEAIQYASMSPHMTNEGRIWLQKILEKHSGELVLKRNNNGRILLINECQNFNSCQVNKNILKTLKSNDAFKTRIEGEYVSIDEIREMSI